MELNDSSERSVCPTLTGPRPDCLALLIFKHIEWLLHLTFSVTRLVSWSLQWASSSCYQKLLSICIIPRPMIEAKCPRLLSLALQLFLSKLAVVVRTGTNTWGFRFWLLLRAGVFFSFLYCFIHWNSSDHHQQDVLKALNVVLWSRTAGDLPTVSGRNISHATVMLIIMNATMH